MEIAYVFSASGCICGEVVLFYENGFVKTTKQMAKFSNEIAKACFGGLCKWKKKAYFNKNDAELLDFLMQKRYIYIAKRI